MMAEADRRSRQAGFTLVELLVVVALLGLISVALFGGIRFGARSWEAGHSRLEEVNEVEVAQSVLRRLLGRSREVSLFTASRDRDAVSFTGRQDAVYFAAPLPAHRGLGGAYGYALGVRRDQDGGQLVLAWRLQRPESPPSADGDFEDETVLLSNIAGVSLVYFGSEEPGRAAVWRDSWDGFAGLPRLVRMTVAFPPDDGRYWPPLTIAPVLAGPVQDERR